MTYRIEPTCGCMGIFNISTTLKVYVCERERV